MKRATALILAVVMILGLSSAFAESTFIWPGEYVNFGHYEQDGNKGNGDEPIRWVVLDVDFTNGSIFLLSEKALEKLPFNKSSNGAAWGDSSLRKWLNDDFIRAAFTDEEAAAIQVTQVEDTLEQSYADANTSNRFSGVTEDKVFCISYYELLTKLGGQYAFCEPTIALSKKNVKLEKVDGVNYCWWWLRTSAFKNNALCMAGSGFTSAYEHFDQGTVRPALWVKTSAVTK